MTKRFLNVTGPSSVWGAGEHAQAWHRRRHLALLALLDESEKKRIKSVLEVGCGVGFSAKCYRDAGFLEGRRYLGVDVDEMALELARKKLPKLAFRNLDITREDVGERFGLVIADSVLEHLEDLDGAVERLYGALVPGGILLVSVPFMEPATSRYALSGSHRSTGIDERGLEEILSGFFAPLVLKRYQIPELKQKAGFGELLFAKAVARLP